MSKSGLDSVDSKLVVTSVNRFHSSVVDLRPSRTVHSVLHQSCSPAFGSSSFCTDIGSRVDCQAVHFGFCYPVQKLSPTVISLEPQLPENSGLQNSVNALKNLSAQIEEIVASQSTASTPRNSMADINLETIDILTSDVQTNLQALVSTFVARDKINRRSQQSDLQLSSMLTSNKSSLSTPASSPTSPPSTITQNVFSGYTPPGTDFNKSRVKKVAAVFNKTTETSSIGATSDLLTPDTELEDFVIPSLNAHIASSLDFNDNKLSSDGQNDSSSDQNSSDGEIRSETKADGARIVRRPKKKNPSMRVDTFTEILNRTQGKSEFTSNGQSIVDYAKNRLQAQKLEEYKPKVRCENGISSPSNQMVSEAKLRWEASNFPSTISETSLQQQMFNALGLSNSNTRKVESSSEKLMYESALNPTHSIPHPKLTSMQKQHIRDRSLSPTAMSMVDGSGPAPVRPFLSKGSVAERVMLFERAPERSVLDKNFTNTNSSNRIRPATWRTVGMLEYSSKFQVIFSSAIFSFLAHLQ